MYYWFIWLQCSCEPGYELGPDATSCEPVNRCRAADPVCGTGADCLYVGPGNRLFRFYYGSYSISLR